MPLTDDDRTWVATLDADAITRFDRGRLRALAGYAEPDERLAIQQLLSTCDHPANDESRHAYYRGVLRGRRHNPTPYGIDNGRT